MTENQTTKEQAQPNEKVRIRLNLTSSIPSKGLTTDPVIHNANEIVEVEPELAKKWTTEKYRRSPTKMCERKGGDFLLPEYITRASYV